MHCCILCIAVLGIVSLVYVLCTLLVVVAGGGAAIAPPTSLTEETSPNQGNSQFGLL